MSGANLTNRNAVRFTPFVYLGTFDEAIDPSSDTDTFKELPIIDFKPSKSANDNKIILIAYKPITNVTGIYTGSSDTIKVKLYMQMRIQMPMTEGTDTVLKALPTWVECQEVTLTDGISTTISGLLATGYRVVPSEVGEGASFVVNGAWYDEQIYTTQSYPKSANYGLEGSVIPPSIYVPVADTANTVYPA